jgi:hypothetical protein
MNSSLRLLATVFIYFICSCNAAHKSKDNSNSKSSALLNDSSLMQERLKLKKYALCKCLLDKYPRDSFLLQDGSMPGYRETGSYGNHAYEAIDSFIQKKSSVSYKSKYKRNLYLMRCIDIYEDPQLELLIKGLDDETSVKK